MNSLSKESNFRDVAFGVIIITVLLVANRLTVNYNREYDYNYAHTKTAYEYVWRADCSILISRLCLKSIRDEIKNLNQCHASSSWDGVCSATNCFPVRNNSMQWPLKQSIDPNPGTWGPPYNDGEF